MEELVLNEYITRVRACDCLVLRRKCGGKNEEAQVSLLLLRIVFCMLSAGLWIMQVRSSREFAGDMALLFCSKV